MTLLLKCALLLFSGLNMFPQPAKIPSQTPSFATRSEGWLLGPGYRLRAVALFATHKFPLQPTRMGANWGVKP